MNKDIKEELKGRVRKGVKRGEAEAVVQMREGKGNTWEWKNRKMRILRHPRGV